MFSSQQQQEIRMMKKNRLKSIWLYNVQESNRKKQMKKQQFQQTKTNIHRLDEQALNVLVTQNQHRKFRRRQQKNMLRDIYQKQMRQKNQKSQLERKIDQEYFSKQQQYYDFEEKRRVLDMAKMYNRITYTGVTGANTLDHRKRIKTEVEQDRYRPINNTSTPHRQTHSKRDYRSMDFKGIPHQSQPEMNLKTSGQQELGKDTLDNLNAESIRYPQEMSFHNHTKT